MPGQTPEVSHLIGLGPGSLSSTADSDVRQVLGPTNAGILSLSTQHSHPDRRAPSDPCPSFWGGT